MYIAQAGKRPGLPLHADPFIGILSQHADLSSRRTRREGASRPEDSYLSGSSAFRGIPRCLSAAPRHR